MSENLEHLQQSDMSSDMSSSEQTEAEQQLGVTAARNDINDPNPHTDCV